MTPNERELEAIYQQAEQQMAEAVAAEMEAAWAELEAEMKAQGQGED